MLSLGARSWAQSRLHMITYQFSKSLINNITTEQWDGVQSLISEPRAIMVYNQEVAEPRTLIALGSCLQNVGVGQLRTYVYHSCQDEHPVKIIDGLAVGDCPMCKGEFAEDNTTYDLELLIKYCVELVD